MNKLFVFLCLLAAAATARASSDSISVIIQGDTVFIWNTGIYQNCAFQGIATVEIQNSVVTVTEKDTGGMYARCMCYFSMCATITGLAPGHYGVLVYRYAYAESIFVGSTSFDVGGAGGALSSLSYQGPCYHPVGAEEAESPPLPDVYGLESFPNPFNPQVTIRYSVPVRSAVTLKIYDVLGREVAVLAAGQFPAGTYERSWNAGSAPSGVYFCTMLAGERLLTKKLLLSR